MSSLTPSDPLKCPACGKLYILVSAHPKEGVPGGHVLVYQHSDGTKCEEPMKGKGQETSDGE